MEKSSMKNFETLNNLKPIYITQTFYKPNSYDVLKKYPTLDILSYMNSSLKEGLLWRIQILKEHYKFFYVFQISVASCERSFSKLKLIQNCMQLTMGQSRLSNSAIIFISIENQLAQSLDYDDIIDEFATVKARKIFL